MPSPHKHLIWDLPQRLFHWGIALACLGAYLSQKLPGNHFAYHQWFGYGAIVLTASRIAWGFAGSHHARFTGFVRGPAAILRYVRSWIAPPYQRHAGHNPLGALMVVALLALLLAVTTTGLFANDQVVNTGPLFGYVSRTLSDRLTTWHAALFNWLLLAASAHVLAVLLYWLIGRENLVGPMVTGYKMGSWPAQEQSQARTWLALLIVAGMAAVLAWIVSTAPQAALSLY